MKTIILTDLELDFLLKAVRVARSAHRMFKSGWSVRAQITDEDLSRIIKKLEEAN